MINIQISDMGASLQKGPIWGRVFIRIFWVLLILTIISYILLMIAFISDWANDGMICALICTILLGLMIGVSLYFIIRNNNLKKDLKLWMHDAVILKALSNTLVEFRALCHPFAEVSIRVKFSYQGKSYIYCSGNNEKPKRYKSFEFYADRELLVLYSPTYEQVMMFRTKSEQRILAELSK